MKSITGGLIILSGAVLIGLGAIAAAIRPEFSLGVIVLGGGASLLVAGGSVAARGWIAKD